MNYLKDLINKNLFLLKMDIPFKVISTDEEEDISYVKREGDEYRFYFNLNELEKRNLDLHSVVVHEIFHVLQFCNGFPFIVVKNENKFCSTVQNVVADFYVTRSELQSGFENEAKTIFCHRLKNAKKENQAVLDDSLFLRQAVVLFEAKKFFADEFAEFYDNLLDIKDRNSEVKGIGPLDYFNVFEKNYCDDESRDVVINLYIGLLRLKIKNLNASIFDNYVLIL